MNNSLSLIKIIEDIMNPEDKYQSDAREGTTTSGVHKKLTSEAKSQIKKSKSQESAKNAAYKYSASEYTPMNKFLRHDTEPYSSETKTYISHLKGLTRNPTKHEFYAYRGVSKPIKGADREGEIFQDKGFTSASLKTRTAQAFAKPGKKDTGHKMFRIHITPGVRGHYVSGHDRINGDEREFVLHPGTKFRVGKTVTHPSGRTFTELHIHSQED